MRKRWICLCVMLAMVAGGGWYFLQSESLPQVSTIAISPMSVEQTVSCNGVVEAADGTGIFLPISCYLKEIKVSAGQRVKKGDVLMVIDKESTCKEMEDPAVRIAVAAMDSNVTAPEDGIVTKVSVKPGEMLKAGAPGILMVRPCDMRVRIAIREKDISDLHEGMRVRLSGDALGDKQYTGTLQEISSAAISTDSVTMLEGVVTLDEDQIDSSFRLGISTKASVITATVDEGYLIPYEAVISDESGSYVYVLQNGVVCRKFVDEGIQLPRGLLVEDPSFLNAAVIAEPEKVYDGQRVAEVAS